MPTVKKSKQHEMLEEIRHISSQLNHLEEIDFKILNHISGRLQDMEKNRREDHLLLLKIAGNFEDILKNINELRLVKKLVMWIAGLTVVLIVSLILK